MKFIQTEEASQKLFKFYVDKKMPISQYITKDQYGFYFEWEYYLLCFFTNRNRKLHPIAVNLANNFVTDPIGHLSKSIERIHGAPVDFELKKLSMLFIHAMRIDEYQTAYTIYKDIQTRCSQLIPSFTKSSI